MGEAGFGGVDGEADVQKWQKLVSSKNLLSFFSLLLEESHIFQLFSMCYILLAAINIVPTSQLNSIAKLN